jgi:hypothetical protein
MNAPKQINTSRPKGRPSKKSNKRFDSNPSSKQLGRNPRKNDTSLALTRSQFTATSPQNYWEFLPASTPGGLRVKGRELIGAASAPSALTGGFSTLNVTIPTGVSNSVALNPGFTFPRLGNIAQAFQEFKFHKADLCFQANQPTTSSGEVLVCAVYDAAASTPSSSTSMMRNITSTMANIYSNASCQILGKLSRLPRYFNSTTTGDDTTIEALFFVAVEGVTAASAATLGYIAIEYDVEFFTPS